MHTKEENVSFGLREKVAPHCLARIHSEENPEGSSCCGQERHELTLYEGYPLFRTKTADQAAYVLCVNTPWYNSTEKRPRWGSVDVSTLEVVQIVESLEVTPVAFEMPVTFDRPLESQDKPIRLASRYLNRELPDIDVGPWRMYVLLMPEGETVESLKEKCTDRNVFIRVYSGAEPEMRYSWGIFELPEEYLDLAKGAPAIGLFGTWRGPADVQS